jgi:hypothetical protein
VIHILNCILVYMSNGNSNINSKVAQPAPDSRSIHEADHFVSPEPIASRLINQNRKLRWDPVFNFPPAEYVMRALYQTQTSPWSLLSLKSAHREKIRERYGEKKTLKHILQKMKAPSFNSIPSIHDKHAPR